MPLSRICCLDLDTFFVSVERLLDPTLVGKPVIVGGRKDGRGVVTACSYEVRPLGVRSGMPIREASRLAPEAIFLTGSHGVYSPYSQQVKAILERYSPEVRAASIDEFYMDFRGCERLHHSPGDVDPDATIERTIWRMRDDIQIELGLPASAGIGSTRAIAKIASGRAKPAGVHMVRVGQEQAFLSPLPVRKFPGIGPVAEQVLLAQDIQILGQLLTYPEDGAEKRVLAMAQSVRRAANPHRPETLGRNRPAFREHDPEGLDVGSISNERTFSADIGDIEGLRAQTRALAERVCWRARKRGIRARTVTVKLRYSDFETLTRGRTIPATNRDAEVLACAHQLVQANHDPSRGVRLLGVCLSNLEGPGGQLTLPFTANEKPAVGGALDAVRARFGYDAIRLGATGDRRDWTG